MDGDFLAYPVRALATQNVHLHDRLDGAKVQFDLLTLAV
jgi:hypothetical protein